MVATLLCKMGGVHSAFSQNHRKLRLEGTSGHHLVDSLLKAEHNPKKMLTFDLIKFACIMSVWGHGSYLLISPTGPHHQCVQYSLHKIWAVVIPCGLKGSKGSKAATAVLRRCSASFTACCSGDRSPDLTCLKNHLSLFFPPGVSF